MAKVLAVARNEPSLKSLEDFITSRGNEVQGCNMTLFRQRVILTQILRETATDQKKRNFAVVVTLSKGTTIIYRVLGGVNLSLVSSLVNPEDYQLDEDQLRARIQDIVGNLSS